MERGGKEGEQGEREGGGGGRKREVKEKGRHTISLLNLISRIRYRESRRFTTRHRRKRLTQIRNPRILQSRIGK